MPWETESGSLRSSHEDLVTIKTTDLTAMPHCKSMSTYTKPRRHNGLDNEGSYMDNACTDTNWTKPGSRKHGLSPTA
ncbi:hypothetical protein NSPZN2_10850 [Nitrospira defluvii]|uniref:Transposase n=1 Tax=Nitrospira defluvii TaxID=330214 RepID=A0ABM8QLT3_9BACT|nr:hypothetical protein NSPZN2_10850 [Nitrospira defluvii]